MNYKQVKLSFTNCELNRFYRTLLVKEDINLVDLGCAILTAFKGAYEHCFLFKANGINYNPLAFIVEIQMDDDVLILPESIARTYRLLRLIKKEYKNDKKNRNNHCKGKKKCR